MQPSLLPSHRLYLAQNPYCAYIANAQAMANLCVRTFTLCARVKVKREDTQSVAKHEAPEAVDHHYVKSRGRWCTAAAPVLDEELDQKDATLLAQEVLQRRVLHSMRLHPLQLVPCLEDQRQQQRVLAEAQWARANLRRTQEANGIQPSWRRRGTHHARRRVRRHGKARTLSSGRYGPPPG